MVAHDYGLPLMGELPSEVEVTVWDGATAAPEGLQDVRFFATPFVPGPHVARALESMPGLQVVQATTAGTNHVAPVVPDGVTLTSARGAPNAATSEWVLTAILAVLRELPAFVADQPIGANERPMADSLDGKRVTILGYGSIGQDIERRLSGFDVALTRIARTPRDGVLSIDRLDAQLPATDVLIVMTPLTEATRDLISRARLAALPNGALVINAARGGILDEAALLDELTRGRLRAALDAAEPDPLPPGHPLRGAPGLLYTPHVAGESRLTVPRVYALVGENVRRCVAGEPLLNVVV